MRSAILLTAPAQVDGKFRLGLRDWRVLGNILAAADADFSIEVCEWPDGLWSCTYGLQGGPMVVDLGNMTLAEWLRRERTLHSAFWA